MNIDFQPVPEFLDGQPIAAADINALRTNILIANNIMNSPQPLFMDTHIYAPKALPLTWRDTEFDIWEGSFMYREGIEKAYLGFHVKLDGMSDLNSEFILSNFNDIAVAVIVKYTSNTYRELYLQNSRYAKALELKNTAPTILTDTSTYWYQFKLNDGHGKTAPPTDSVGGYSYITPNSRVSEIEIDVSMLGLADGEIVPVKLVLVAHKDASVNNTPTKNNPGDGYTSFFNKFFWSGGFDNRNRGALVARSHIFYSMLYAQTDGDLSYSDNWPATAFVSTGSNVLAQSNLDILTKKQRYITERLRNRPMPLVGSIFYISAWGGTSSVRYPALEIVPGEWDFYKSTYSVVNRYNTEDTEDIFKPQEVLNMSYSFNAQSNLATYAWNPYFPFYSSAFVNFKFYGNTDARQVLITDFTEQPVSSTSIRRNILYWLAPGVGRFSGHLSGYYGTSISGVALDSWTGYYGSVFADHQTSSSVLTTSPSVLPKVYLNHTYNVRIPSDTTPVYSPEFDVFSTNSTNPQAKYFLTKGLWEDSVQIRFEKDNSVVDSSGRGREGWQLAKDVYDNTINYGFVGNASINDTMDGFNGLYTPLNRQEKQLQYIQVSGYNTTNWKWITESGVRGWSQVFVNLYEHSRPSLTKANYISYIHMMGISVYNPSYRLYGVPTEYTPGQLADYSALRTLLGDINTDLNYLRNTMFINNPHFRRYDMFWGAPKSVLGIKRLFSEYNKEFYYITKQRVGNILIVRGKNVTLYYGEIEELKREEDPKGTLHEMGSVGVQFKKNQSIISGDAEQTVVFHLDNIDDLGYNQYYYLKGDSIVYAAEFYEEPS